MSLLFWGFVGMPCAIIFWVGPLLRSCWNSSVFIMLPLAFVNRHLAPQFHCFVLLIIMESFWLYWRVFVRLAKWCLLLFDPVGFSRRACKSDKHQPMMENQQHIKLFQRINSPFTESIILPARVKWVHRRAKVIQDQKWEGDKGRNAVGQVSAFWTLELLFSCHMFSHPPYPFWQQAAFNPFVRRRRPQIDSA